MTAVRSAAARTACWQALGTSAVLRLAERGPLAEARGRVEAELAAIDRACSRFRADSELCALNASAGRPFRAGPLLAEALAVALRAAQLTDGDLDPSVGVALELAGYDRDWSLIERGEQDARASGRHAISAPRLADAPALATTRVRAHLRAGWRAIELHRDTGVVRMPAEVKLDLGATAKAWAADRAAKAAFEATGAGVLVALGGDVATAGPAPVEGWRVRVTDDHHSGPSAPGQTVTIRSGGLATSSTTVRRWIKGGAEMHHIIDPRTGEPARGRWRTASVAAASCTDANIASTAAILRSERAPVWLADLKLPARLVAHDGAITTVGGWPVAGSEHAAA